VIAVRAAVVLLLPHGETQSYNVRRSVIAALTERYYLVSTGSRTLSFTGTIQFCDNCAVWHITIHICITTTTASHI
jgi:hypothetical protein